MGLTLTSLHKCFGGSPLNTSFLAGIAMCDVDLGSLKTIKNCSPESFVAFNIIHTTKMTIRMYMWSVISTWWIYVSPHISNNRFSSLNVLPT